jgi:hypothetical protein
MLSYRVNVDPNANGLGRVDQNQDGSLTRVELIKRLRKDEELVSLLNLPKHVSDGDRGAFEAVFQGCACPYVRAQPNTLLNKHAPSGGTAWTPTTTVPWICTSS